MKRVSIRDLHLHTGKWVRGVAEHRRIVITDRGRPVATIMPFDESETTATFSQRRQSKKFRDLGLVKGDSEVFIGEDRNR